MDVHKPKDTARNIYIYILMTWAKQKSSMHPGPHQQAYKKVISLKKKPSSHPNPNQWTSTCRFFQ